MTLIIRKSLLEYIIYLMADLAKAAEFKALGNAAFKEKNWEEAIGHFTKAIQYNPNDHVFFSNRSASYLNNGQHQEALADAEKCVAVNPNWPKAYSRKGTALFYLGQIDEAIQTYKQGLQIDPSDAALQKDLAAAEQKKAGAGAGAGAGGAPQMNPAFLQAALKLMQHPETKELFQDPSFMQQLQMIMANPAMAQVLMQQDPRLKKVMEVLQQQTNPDEMANLEAMFNKQNFNAPPPPAEKKEQSSPPPPPPKKEEKKPEKMEPEDPAEKMKEKGNQEFKKHNFHEALNFYDEAIKLNSQQPLYYNNKAAAFIELKDFEAAMIEIDRALKLFQEGVVKDFVKKAKILARKGTIHMRLDQLDEATQAFEKSLLEDNVPKVKDELKKVHKLKKDLEAKQYINPEIAEQNCEQGNALYKEGKFPQAVKEYEEAIRRNPEVAKYYSNLGQVFIKLMEFGRAKENYDIALQKDPNFVKAYHKKGDCHFLMKEYHKALECYEKGLKIDPSNEICRAGITKTQQTIYAGGNSQQDQEERARRAMADPEIQAILQTPEVRNALSELERDPKSLNSILQNKNIAAKLQKLIQAGILRVG